jgi:SAM-dependent methyltransferase
VEKEWLFDRKWTRDFTAIRQKFVAEFLESVRSQITPKTALDVGCGVGDFSKFLSEMGMKVVGIDGRSKNVSEAKRRYPEIQFRTANAEDFTADDVGMSDLVLCFGLLYHLENPFRAIRKLYAVTRTVLIIETMRLPSAEATMELLDEGIAEDQGLNYVAFYPSETALIKMLYKSGFSYVYRFARLPADELYSSSVWQKRLRTILAASHSPLGAPNLILEPKPVRRAGGGSDPWTTVLGRVRHSLASNLFKLKVLGARLLRPQRKETNSDAKHS